VKGDVVIDRPRQQRCARKFRSIVDAKASGITTNGSGCVEFAGSTLPEDRKSRLKSQPFSREPILERHGANLATMK
jgi:hypothetical protein